MKRLLGTAVLSLALGLTLTAPSSALCRSDVQVVKQLASRLEEGVRRVRFQAERWAGQLDPRERRMLRSLYEVEGAANRFRRTVDDWWRSRWAIEQEQRRLQSEAIDVERAIYYSRLMQPFVGEWRQAMMNLRQIDMYMSRNDAPGHGAPGYGGHPGHGGNPGHSGPGYGGYPGEGGNPRRGGGRNGFQSAQFETLYSGFGR